MTDPILLEREIKTLIAFLNESTTAVIGGEMLSLDGVDTKVARLCQAVEALPPAQAKPFEEHLKRMIIALDHLVTALKTSTPVS